MKSENLYVIALINVLEGSIDNPFDFEDIYYLCTKDGTKYKLLDIDNCVYDTSNEWNRKYIHFIVKLDDLIKYDKLKTMFSHEQIIEIIKSIKNLNKKYNDNVNFADYIIRKYKEFKVNNDFKSFCDAIKRNYEYYTETIDFDEIVKMIFKNYIENNEIKEKEQGIYQTITYIGKDDCMLAGIESTNKESYYNDRFYLLTISNPLYSDIEYMVCEKNASNSYKNILTGEYVNSLYGRIIKCEDLNNYISFETIRHLDHFDIIKLLEKIPGSNKQHNFKPNNSRRN